MMENRNNIIVWLIGAVWAFFEPITDFLLAMIILFTLNYVLGFTSGLVQGESWSMKKTLKCFLEWTMFFLMLTCFFAIGHFLHKQDESMYCVQWVCIVATWAYLRNIVKNGKVIVPNNSTMFFLLDILDYVLSFKVLSKITFLQEYIEKRKKEANNNCLT